MEGNIENIISQLQNLIDDLKKLEKHSFGDKEILIPANVIVWGTITGDLACGVQAKFEFN